MDKEGRYIYCIIDTDGSLFEFGPIGIGDRGDAVYTIAYKDIGAVVSVTPMRRYAVTREYSLAHIKTIEEVMKRHGVLPVRFCTIAENEEQVKRILEKEYENFKNSLKSIRDKEEIGVKAVLSENIFQDIAASDEFVALKKSISAKPLDATYGQRVKAGQMVLAALERVKEQYKEDILKTLTPISVDIRVNKNIGDRMVVNAAFLVDMSRERQFDEGVAKLDGRYGGRLKLKYVCNLPPYNFVNIAINVREY